MIFDIIIQQQTKEKDWKTNQNFVVLIVPLNGPPNVSLISGENEFK